MSDVRLDVLDSEPSCTLCGLHKDATHVCISTHRDALSLPWSEDGTVILFVGDRPGIHEDREGRNFAGPAGDILCSSAKPDILPHSIIDLIGARDRASVWLANATRCYTPADRPPANSFVQCSDYLADDLEQLWTPRAAVVAMGNGAISSVARIAGVSAPGLAKAVPHQGTTFYLPRAWTFFAMPNPAILMVNRAPAQGRSIARYCNLIRMWLDGRTIRKSRIVPLNPATNQPYGDPS